MGENGGPARWNGSDLPETIAPGSVLLVTGPDASVVGDHCLRVLHRRADAGDAAIVVTTAGSDEETIAKYSSITGEGPAAPIGIVDTASRGQNLTAFHRAVPTVFTPGPADLARVAVAIDNLDAQLASADVTHLVVRSVSSFFEGDDPSTVVQGIRRAFGGWTEDGLVVLGADFTAVDGSTIVELEDLADVVVRVAVTPSGDCRQ